MLGLLHYAKNTLLPGQFRFLLEYAEEQGRNPIYDLIQRQCPHLTGDGDIPKATRWLASGHLQTVYSVLGDFSRVDEVEYKRKVFLTPDGGTVALDIGTYTT